MAVENNLENSVKFFLLLCGYLDFRSRVRGAHGSATFHHVIISRSTFLLTCMHMSVLQI